MPKECDYSNTIIYKIYCKDENIKDLYIGHTVNFVERKKSHMQCSGPTGSRCKLYNTIRNNGGWDNWNMDIVHFFKCDSLTQAKMKEQEYYDLYKATLNSVAPFQKEKIVKVKTKKIDCDISNVETKYVCNICDGNDDYLEKKNDSLEKTAKKFMCENCNFTCSKKSNFEQHETTAKHIRRINTNKEKVTAKIFTCECGLHYKHMSSLCNHRKKCSKQKKEIENDMNKMNITDKELIMQLLQENKEFKNMMMEMISKPSANIINTNSHNKQSKI